MDRPDLLPDVLIALREEGIAIEGLNVQKPSLDEVFLTITGKPADPTSEEQAA
jgi:ABC-2 type transport system ATP-binding protein